MGTLRLTDHVSWKDRTKSGVYSSAGALIVVLTMALFYARAGRHCTRLVYILFWPTSFYLLIFTDYKHEDAIINCMIFGACGIALGNLSLFARQRWRDREAELISAYLSVNRLAIEVDDDILNDSINILSSGKPPNSSDISLALNHALLLRPFDFDHWDSADERLKGSILLGSLFHANVMYLSDDISFERTLATNIQNSKYQRLLSYGRYANKYGAGRIYLEEVDWKIILSHHMDAAGLIIVIVGNRDGTVWEMDNIITNKLIEKCIFILPGDDGFISDLISKESFSPEESWHFAADYFASKGFEQTLIYNGKGAAFVVEKQKIKVISQDLRENFLQKLLVSN